MSTKECKFNSCLQGGVVLWGTGEGTLQKSDVYYHNSLSMFLPRCTSFSLMIEQSVFEVYSVLPPLGVPVIWPCTPNLWNVISTISPGRCRRFKHLRPGFRSRWRLALQRESGRRRHWRRGKLTPLVHPRKILGT